MDDERFEPDAAAPARPPHPDDPLPAAATPPRESPVPTSPPLAPPLPPPPGRDHFQPVYRNDDPVAKSTALAVFLSVLPGLGHLYVGAYQRAVMIVTVFFLAIYLLPLPLAVFIPLFVWFFGLFDAYRLAQLAELEHAPVGTRHEHHAKGTLAFGVFLAVVGLVVLADNLWNINLDWLRDWWPAILVLAGAYFIIEAVRERVTERSPTQSVSLTESDEP